MPTSRDNLYSEAELFSIVSEMEPGAVRDSYLTQACGGDTKLKERMNRLLSFSTIDHFLESQPLLTELEVEKPTSESIGDMIGPYKLLQKIGEGGMGIVYMADQLEPVRRKVAIKVIKPGMDSAQVLLRFETERQAVVMMDHPNIARALDAGTTSLGRPYFVMELVRGIPITQYCDEQRLDTESRLALFVPVCSAVQHAHVKGIIHRDLKPSNVLVADYDQQPVPKVIDFGISKAVDQQISHRTMFTQLGQIVGTVEYMSPEQSKMNQLDVDTRSDVYSLGVLLYELLSGSPPIQSNQYKELGWEELTRVIREESPPVPSVRISKSETIADIAARRRTEPDRLSRLVRGELDWIVMKALEKDRARRYQTPNDLALDLQRYLKNEAVAASPPSTLYQISKFARRHRFAMISGALVAFSLMIGLIGTVWQARESYRATIRAEEQRDIAQAERERAQQAERAASLAAEQSKRDAEISQAISSFVNQDLLAFSDPDLEPDRGIQLRTLLDRAAQSVSDLQKAPRVEAALRHTIANAYLNLGEYHDAMMHASRALELRKHSNAPADVDSLDSYLLVAEIQLKSALFRDASKSFQEAIDLCNNNLGPTHPLTLRGLRGLGTSWFQLGKLDDARDHFEGLLETQIRFLGPKHRDTFETRRELADLLQAKGQYQKSLAEFSTLLTETTETFGATHPLTLKTKSGVASVLLTIGKLEESRMARREILEAQLKVLGPGHPDTLLTNSLLSSFSIKKGQLNEAEQQQRRLLYIAESRLGDQHLIAIQLSTALADILTERGNITEAKQLYVKALDATLELLDHNNPITLRLKQRFAGLVAFSGQYDDAFTQYQEVLDARRLVLGPHHTDTLTSLSAIAEIEMNRLRYRESEVLVQELIQNAEKSLGTVHPLTLQAKGKLYTLMSLQGHSEDAVAPFQELVTLCDHEHGKQTPISIELAVSFGEALGRLNFQQQSLSILEERLPDSIALYGNEHPTTLRIQDSAATVLRLLGKVNQSTTLNNEVLAIRKRILGETHPLTLRSINNLGTCYVAANEPKKGAEMFRIAFTASKSQFGADASSTLEYGQNLASTLGLLKEGEECFRLFQEILEAQRNSLGEAHPTLLFTQMGLAGAFSHHERYAEAERLYATVLESQRSSLGESHPDTLVCQEKLLVVLGKQNRFAEAISLGKDYITIAKDKYPGLSSVHRVMHCLIEYYIVQGQAIEAEPWISQSQEWIDRFQLSNEWMINDLPHFAYAQMQVGKTDAAIETMKQHALNCESRLGGSHPIAMLSQFQVAKLLSKYGRKDEADARLALLKEQLDSAEKATPKADARLVQLRALLDKQHEELANLADIAAAQGNWLKATTIHLQRASIAIDDPNSPRDISQEALTAAINALEQAYSAGIAAKPRELALLKSAPDYQPLRSDPRFLKLIANIEKQIQANVLSVLAWSHAMAGHHTLAKSHAIELLALDLPSKTAMLNRYNACCVFGRCYQATCQVAGSQLAGAQSDDYLQLAIENLERCWADGFFTTQEGLRLLKEDEDLAAIRGTTKFQELLQRISP